MNSVMLWLRNDTVGFFLACGIVFMAFRPEELRSRASRFRYAWIPWIAGGLPVLAWLEGATGTAASATWNATVSLLGATIIGLEGLAFGALNFKRLRSALRSERPALRRWLHEVVRAYLGHPVNFAVLLYGNPLTDRIPRSVLLYVARYNRRQPWRISEMMLAETDSRRHSDPEWLAKRRGLLPEVYLALAENSNPYVRDAIAANRWAPDEARTLAALLGVGPALFV